MCLVQPRKGRRKCGGVWPGPWPLGTKRGEALRVKALLGTDKGRSLKLEPSGTRTSAPDRRRGRSRPGLALSRRKTGSFGRLPHTKAKGALGWGHIGAVFATPHQRFLRAARRRLPGPRVIPTRVGASHESENVTTNVTTKDRILDSQRARGAECRVLGNGGCP